ncbi:MAG TPA: flagellar export chaperone FliS [Chitinispirillaceae bacterium]|nr:flagellar export chaperone FliS [Chitinispirillaceae bacterium]
MKQGYNVYKTANVDTADQGKLILIAYDVAIINCKMALEKFDDRHLIEERTKHIFKVQDAITELLSALKLDVGEIARNLYNLYDYMLRCLVEASIKHNKDKITEVLGYLEALRGAWAEAVQKIKLESVADYQMKSMAV